MSVPTQVLMWLARVVAVALGLCGALAIGVARKGPVVPAGSAVPTSHEERRPHAASAAAAEAASPSTNGAKAAAPSRMSAPVVADSLAADDAEVDDGSEEEEAEEGEEEEDEEEEEADAELLEDEAILEMLVAGKIKFANGREMWIGGPGDRGKKGPDGFGGRLGRLGKRGPNGPTGERGNKGPRGRMGKKGPPGPPGVYGKFDTEIKKEWDAAPVWSLPLAVLIHILVLAAAYGALLPMSYGPAEAWRVGVLKKPGADDGKNVEMQPAEEMTDAMPPAEEPVNEVMSGEVGPEVRESELTQVQQQPAAADVDPFANDLEMLEVQSQPVVQGGQPAGAAPVVHHETF